MTRTQQLKDELFRFENMKKILNLFWQVYQIEDMLTAGELKQLRDSGDTLLEEWKTLDDLKSAQNMKILSPMGVEHFNKFINSAGDLGNKVAIAMYLEGIIKFTKLRIGEMKKGEKSLPQYLPLSVKKKIFNQFAQSSGNNKVSCWKNTRKFGHQI